MNTEQKGFIVYKDIQAVVDELTDEQAGQLFRGMLEYFSDGTDPDFDGVLKFVFIPIRQQMDRDSEKYDKKCEKNRANIKKRWKSEDKKEDATVYDRIESNATVYDGIRPNTNVYERIRTHTNDTNTKTNTNTDTKTKTDIDTKTTTTTNTNTKDPVVVVVQDDGDDDFDLRKKLSAADVDTIYDVYPDSGGDLIDEVSANVKKKRTRVDHPVAYILGYAENVGWLGG